MQPKSDGTPLVCNNCGATISVGEEKFNPLFWRYVGGRWYHWCWGGICPSNARSQPCSINKEESNNEHES